MRLDGVQPDDIVETDSMLARVLRREGRKLVVVGICNKSLRRVSAREVTRHWRLAGRRANA